MFSTFNLNNINFLVCIFNIINFYEFTVNFKNIFKNSLDLKISKNYFLSSKINKNEKKLMDFEESLFENDSLFNKTEIGFISKIGDGIAFVIGMTEVAAGELIYIPQAKNMQGMVLNLESEGVGIVLFGNDQYVSEGFLVCRTHKSVYIKVGFFLLGRVLDGLGNPIDNLGTFEEKKVQMQWLMLKHLV